MIVTGPSFAISTAISAPKMPFSTFLTPFAESSEQNSSYNLFASSGAAESVKDGLLPFLQSAQRVNCEIARISPPTSLTLSVFVLEHAQTRYFAGKQRRLLIGVALDNAEQDIEALAYLADGLPVNGNF